MSSGAAHVLVQSCGDFFPYAVSDPMRETFLQQGFHIFDVHCGFLHLNSPLAVTTFVGFLHTGTVPNSTEIKPFLLSMCIDAPRIHNKFSFLCFNRRWPWTLVLPSLMLLCEPIAVLLTYPLEYDPQTVGAKKLRS